MPKEKKTPKLKQIYNEGKSKNNQRFYFLAETEVNKALRIAQEQNPAVPQRFEEWYVVCLVEKGARPPLRTDKDFVAPEDGIILKKNEGSAW